MKNSHNSISSQIFIIIMLTSFVASTYGFGFYLFSQLIPDMRNTFGFSYSTAGTITATGQMGFLAFAFLGTWLSPKIGGGKVIIGSIFLCGLCLLLIPIAGNIVIVGFLLTILGGTAASVYVPMVEIVGKTIAYEHRGKALGLISSGTSYGVFINSLLVPIFLQQSDWQGVWFAVGAGTSVVALLSLYGFKKLDLLPVGYSSVEPDSKQNSNTLALSAFSPSAIIICSITFLNGCTTMPFQNYLSAYLREELEFSIIYAAQIWGVIGFIGMFSGLIVGWLSDRVGVKISLLFTYLCIFVASIILAFFPEGLLPFIACILFAVGFYPIFGLVPAYIAKTHTGEECTAIFGFANITLGLGGILGNYTAGLQRSHTDTFVWNYIAIAVLTLLLCILTICLKDERKKL